MNKVYALKYIETPRLLIRPVQLGDEFELNKSINNSLKILNKWMPWANDPSLKATRDFIQRGVFARCSQLISNFPMIAIHKQDQKIISGSGYNEQNNPNIGHYEIGYWCDIDYQGQGYVTEIVNALTRYALEELNAKKVLIRINIENAKSIAVAKRLNFVNQDKKPSTLNENVFYYFFECQTSDNLPPLSVSWSYERSNNFDSKMISWAHKVLKISDEEAFATSKAIVKTPWSNVFEINTGSEVVYLKHTPKDLFLESAISELLLNRGEIDNVPKIMFKNPKILSFIMKRCGDVTLRDHFNGAIDFNILNNALEGYISLQKTSIPLINELIDLGVPDWRLNKFPSLYDKLVTDKVFLNVNGINKDQQKILSDYKPNVSDLCAKLSSYGISECLNHSDFHDNNILYDNITKTTAIIDLGETAINHPLFSLMACFVTLKHRYKKLENAEYNHLIDKSLSKWFNDKDKQANVIEIVSKLLPIYLIFTQKRFLDAINMPFDPDDSLSVKQHEKIYKAFIWFIDNMKT